GCPLKRNADTFTSPLSAPTKSCELPRSGRSCCRSFNISVRPSGRTRSYRQSRLRCFDKADHDRRTDPYHSSISQRRSHAAHSPPVLPATTGEESLPACAAGSARGGGHPKSPPDARPPSPCAPRLKRRQRVGREATTGTAATEFQRPW